MNSNEMETCKSRKKVGNGDGNEINISEQSGRLASKPSPSKPQINSKTVNRRLTTYLVLPIALYYKCSTGGMPEKNRRRHFKSPSKAEKHPLISFLMQSGRAHCSGRSATSGVE